MRRAPSPTREVDHAELPGCEEAAPTEQPHVGARVGSPVLLPARSEDAGLLTLGHPGLHVFPGDAPDVAEKR